MRYNRKEEYFGRHKFKEVSIQERINAWLLFRNGKFQKIKKFKSPYRGQSKFPSAKIRISDPQFEQDAGEKSMFPKIEINLEDRSILTDTFFNRSVSWRSTLKFFTGIVRKPGVLVLGWGFGIILTVVFEFVSSKFSISARIFLIFYYSTERLSYFSAKV